MRIPDIRLNVIIMTFSWLASSFNYYMVGFLLKYFPGNVYVNGAVSAISEVVATILAGVIYEKLGCKKAFVFMYALSTVGGVGIVIYEMSVGFYKNDTELTSGWFFPFLVLFAKFGISSAFTLNYLCNVDLFPVLFVSTAYGFCNFFARFFTIFAPQVAEIQSVFPMTLFSIFSCIAMITSMFLKVKPKEDTAATN